MRVNVNWKRVLFVVVDLILAAYLVMAVTLWNTPASASRVCSKVDVNISDANNVGFLSAEEIKHILTQQGLYPLGKPIAGISPRSIEEVLRTSPFVNTAECHVTQNGHVTIALTQRVPIIRIKSSRGDDYYIDDKGCADAQLQIYERPDHRHGPHQPILRPQLPHTDGQGHHGL